MECNRFLNAYFLLIDLWINISTYTLLFSNSLSHEGYNIWAYGINANWHEANYITATKSVDSMGQWWVPLSFATARVQYTFSVINPLSSKIVLEQQTRSIYPIRFPYKHYYVVLFLCAHTSHCGSMETNATLSFDVSKWFWIQRKWW